MDSPYDTFRQWEHAFNKGDSSAVAALYTPDAILWGALAQDLIVSPEAIRSYFVDAAAAGFVVALGEHKSTRLSETCVADAGQYELTRTANGAQASFPARYSIVLVRINATWIIAHHHSSMLPKALD